MPHIPYPNATEINVSRGLDELFVYSNTITDSWFVSMLMIATYVILLFAHGATRGRVSGESFSIAGFVLFIIAILFRVGGLISNQIMYVVFALSIVSIIPLFFPKRD